MLIAKLQEDMPPNVSKMLVLQAPYYEGNLAALRANLFITTCTDEENEPSQTLEDTLILYDTGAQISHVSDGLLRKELLVSQRLRHPL